MTSHTAYRRQYQRQSVDLRAQLVIGQEHATQVAPISGSTITGRLTDISPGGAHVIVPTFLPRLTKVGLEIAPAGGAASRDPAGKPPGGEQPPSTARLGGVRARVVSVRMIDREPRYGLGLRFEDPNNPAVETLLASQSAESQSRSTDAAGRPAASEASGAATAGRTAAWWTQPDIPPWIGLVAREGLAGSEILQTAWRETGGDSRRAGEWLVEHGCLAQRDLTLAQAAGSKIPFVDLADFRVNLENRRLVPEELARGKSVFPVFAIDRIITLAVSWPLDLPTLDHIRLHTGCEVDQALANPRDLQHLLEWAYGSFQGPADGRATELAWDDLLKDVADAPAVKLVNVLLDQAAASQASDIHVEAEEQALRVRFRIDGVLREVPAPPKALLPAIVSRIKVLAHMSIAETRRPQDGQFKFAVGREELDVRVSTLPCANGESVVLRLLRSGSRLLSLEELGMDPQTQQAFDRLIHLPHGMLLVTGPTGSGKTTTLYSALTRIDRVRQSIVTLEDPVEVRLPQIRQVSVNPKAGLTFYNGLRAILRQDPDVIMVGEIRDRETAETALHAALTGHLMLSTLHTNSAAASPARLIDMGVQDFLVSSALVGVLAQRLCRRLCRHCAHPAEHPDELLAPLPRALARRLADVELLEPVGCGRCGHTGYEGRVGIFELMVVTDEIRRAVLKRQDERTLVRLACANGMRLLAESGLAAIRDGLTTVQEVLRVTGALDLGPAGVADDGHAFADATAEQHAGFGEAGTPDRPRIGREVEPAFDAQEYEQLLKRWLRSHAPAARPTAAAASGRCEA